MAATASCVKRPAQLCLKHLTLIVALPISITGSFVRHLALESYCCDGRCFVPQVLLHCCRCCPHLCEAAVTSGLPDVLLRSACTSSNSTATLALLVLAEVVSGVAAAADALASGLPLAGSPAAAAAAAAAAADAVRQSGSDRQQGQGQGQGQHQQQQPQHDQWHEQALRMRRQQLAAALQVVRPSKATDGVIERLSGVVLCLGCAWDCQGIHQQIPINNPVLNPPSSRFIHNRPPFHVTLLRASPAASLHIVP